MQPIDNTPALKNRLRNPKWPNHVVGAKMTAVRIKQCTSEKGYARVRFDKMYPNVPLFRLPETDVKSCDFSFTCCFRIAVSF